MKALTVTQTDELIDRYCNWFTKTADRKVLEMMAWDCVHEDLHQMPFEILMETIERDCPDLLE